MNTKLYQYFIPVLLLVGGLFGASSQAINENVFLSAIDIEAGQTTTIRSSGLSSQENTSLILKRPSQSPLSFSMPANTEGVGLLQIPSLHTEKAGDYQLELFREFSKDPVATDTFTVFAGNPSPFRSTIELSEGSIPADGKTPSFLAVSLKDAFGNPLPHTPIQGFSSRNEDQIVLQGFTDAQGIARGKVFSSTPGVATLSFFTEGTVLFEKPEVVFHINTSSIKNAGSSGFGQYLQSSLFNGDEQGAGTTEYLTIEGLNAEQTAYEDLTVRVSAKDANGNVDTNYRGVIRFSSTDEKATLPTEYTFKEADQGVHTFYLAVSFGTVGQQSLSVLDIDDFRLSGKLNVNVLPKDGGQPPSSGGDGRFQIDIPTVGAKFNSSRVTIAGYSDSCPVIKLVDGPTVLIERLATDSNGAFSYQTPGLADGYHEFQMVCPSNDLVSEKVGIQIDRSGPTVMSVEISPSTCVKPSEPFQIKLGSSEDLSNANCIINNKTISFEAIDSKNFQAQSAAPNAVGQYPVQCSIFDMLGNELYEENAEVLEVCSPDEEPPAEEPKNIAPSCVSNLNAKPEEEKVTLFWSPSKDDEGISRYKVLYGECGNPLSQENITPDDRTQWYIDGLESCKKYCFSVSPIDSQGLENEICSEQIQEAPICSEPPEITPPKSGRSPAFPLIISLLIGITSFLFLAKRKSL